MSNQIDNLPEDIRQGLQATLDRTAEDLIAYAYDKPLFSGEFSDRIIAGAGDDLLIGGKGNDFLNGDLGDDVLVGGAGKDTLIGSGGNNLLTGSKGRDTFMLSTEGTDIITDFEGDRFNSAKNLYSRSLKM